MICITEAETDKQIEDLKEVITKMKTGSLVARVKQFIKKPDGNGFNEMVIKENSFDGTFTININNTAMGFLYLDVVCPKKADMRAVYNLWDIVLKRGTQRYLDRKDSDYALVIDITKGELEHNKIYVFSGFQPVWMNDEGSSLITKENSFRIVFQLAKVFYEVADVTPAEQEYYEMENSYEDGYEDEEEFQRENSENEPDTELEDITDDLMNGENYL